MIIANVAGSLFIFQGNDAAKMLSVETGPKVGRRTGVFSH